MTNERALNLARAGKTDGEIASELGVSSRTVLRWRKAAGVPAGWTPPEATHGKKATYNRGCRCAPCTEAQRLHVRGRRAGYIDRLARGDVPESFEHGISAYRNWGCRCDVCREAGRIDNAIYYRAGRKPIHMRREEQ